MIEVNTTWELLPNIDEKAYGEWAKKTVGTVLKAPGIVEFRAHRNILGSSQIRSTAVWQSLSDWANYTDSDEWQALDAEFRTFVKDIHIEIWGLRQCYPNLCAPVDKFELKTGSKLTLSLFCIYAIRRYCTCALKIADSGTLQLMQILTESVISLIHISAKIARINALQNR
jgi:heme-degrading monooxygenase HmoA